MGGGEETGSSVQRTAGERGRSGDSTADGHRSKLPARIHFDYPDVSGVPPLIRAARIFYALYSAHALRAECHAPVRERGRDIPGARTKADIARIIINTRLCNERPPTPPSALPSRAHDTSMSFTFTGRTEIGR